MNPLQTDSASRLSCDLEALLAAQPNALVAAVQQRTRAKLEAHHHRLILFGTGQLGRVALNRLQKIGKRPLAFADNNPMLRGKCIEGIPILSPVEALAHHPGSLVVVTVYTNAPVFAQLRDMGIEAISFGELAWCYPESFLPWQGLELPYKIAAQADAVRAGYALWEDEQSRREYLGQIAWRQSLDASTLPPHSSAAETYFAPDLFEFRRDEVFVDCGAFDGDSIRAFLQLRGDAFQKIIGLEPDPMNRHRLDQWTSGLPTEQAAKIEVLPYAAGERRERIFFEGTGTVTSSVGSGQLEVQSVPIDAMELSAPPSFIKMDIEGAEPSALRGAGKILLQHQPILAICLYHAQEHLWRIPLLIQEINPDYNLYLRRYSDECWELVCYAVPKSRCKKP